MNQKTKSEISVKQESKICKEVWRLICIRLTVHHKKYLKRCWERNDDEISYIQKKNNRKLVFSNKVDHRKVGRGNPLLSRRRIKTMDKVNAGLSRIK